MQNVYGTIDILYSLHLKRKYLVKSSLGKINALLLIVLILNELALRKVYDLISIWKIKLNYFCLKRVKI